MRLRGRTDVVALDVGPFVAALPALLADWRALTFVDAGVVHPVTGEAHEGFRVVDGVHPYPGTTYRLVLCEETAPDPTPEEMVVARRLDDADPRAAAEWERGRAAAARAAGAMKVTWHTFDVTVGNDDAQRTTFAVHHDVTDFRARIDLTTPSKPGPIDIALDVPDWGGKTAFLRGMVQVLLRLDAAESLPRLVAGMSHPRGRAHAEVDVAAAGRGRWTVTAHVDVRGAGWMRPLVAVMGPFVRGQLQRGLDDILAGLREHFDAMAARYPSPPPDPHTLAERVLADLISAVPIKL
jgi:hypothetical protein